MDEELLELCKAVFEKLDWRYEAGINGTWLTDGYVTLATWVENGVPLYTSDYLLDKLPRTVERYGSFELVPTMRNTRWSAGYWSTDRLNTLSAVDYTPLKALLKLTIALHDGGRLKAGDA